MTDSATTTPRVMRAQRSHEQTRSHFLDAMSRVASTVVLVTTYVDSQPWGMTVSAFCSVSADPPTCLVSLNRSTMTAQQIRASGVFGVAVLSEGQVPVALRGSRPRAARFVSDLCSEESLAMPGWDTATDQETSGLPTSDHPFAGGFRTPRPVGSIAHLDCTVHARHEAGDHDLVIGRVRAVHLGTTDARPLLYHERAFRTVGPTQES